MIKANADLDEADYVKPRHPLNMDTTPKKQEKTIVKNDVHSAFPIKPKEVEFANREAIDRKPGYIPGYAGFVPKIKSENLYANTFAKITKDIQEDNFICGMDQTPEERYLSTYTQKYEKPFVRPKIMRNNG